jgi:hypothetical protein
MFQVNSEVMSEYLISLVNSQNSVKMLSALQAVRNFTQNECSQYVVNVSLTSNDIHVRRCCLLTISELSFDQFSSEVQSVVFSCLLKDSEIKSENIREVNLGPFVHKVSSHSF